MTNYLMFGFRAGDLIEIRSLVEERLGIKLLPHESSFHAGEYFRSGLPGNENFILQNNYDAADSDWTVPNHMDLPILLFVNETTRSTEIEEALEGLAEAVSLGVDPRRTS